MYLWIRIVNSVDPDFLEQSDPGLHADRNG